MGTQIWTKIIALFQQVQRHFAKYEKQDKIHSIYEVMTLTILCSFCLQGLTIMFSKLPWPLIQDLVKQ